jgi:hypothetical protein
MHAYTVHTDSLDSSGGGRSPAALARDPAIVAGIYDACDQWCAYCSATNRCLAFRASNAAEVGGVFQPAGGDGEQVSGGSILLKVLADAEGRLAPPEIEAVASGDARLVQDVFSLNDPLERLGRRYMTLADAYLGSRPDFPESFGAWRREGPSALEVLAWFHTLAPARVFRALLCDAEARRGIHGRRTDMLRAAKVALIGLDRSSAAIETLQLTDDDPRLALMLTLVRQLRQAVESRFSGARSHLRPGLDVETLRRSSLQRGLRRLRRLLDWRDWRSRLDAGDSRGGVGR